MRSHKHFLSLLMVVAAVAVSLAAYPRLPERMPVHWGPSGHADRFGSRATGSMMLPAAMLAIWLFLTFAPRFDMLLFLRYDARRRDDTTAQRAYDGMVAVVLMVLLVIHTVTIGIATGIISGSYEPTLIACVVSLGAIAIGNYTPRITHRNAFIGFRVPSAYTSEEAWRRTQRAAGYGMVLAGIIGLAGAIASPASPLKPFFSAMAVQMVVVAVYSYVIARNTSLS